MNTILFNSQLMLDQNSFLSVKIELLVDFEPKLKWDLIVILNNILWAHILLSEENNVVYSVRPEKFQFLEKGQNRNFDYKIVILVKNPKFIL